MSYGESAEDRLAAVRASINKCLEAQEYGVGARRKRMAELSQLRAMEKDLMAEVAASGGTQWSVLTMDRPV